MTWEEIKAQYREENPLLAEAVDIAIKMVTDMDMVEVVRCKECKWRGEYLSCPIPYRTEDNFFCGKGERKTK